MGSYRLCLTERAKEPFYIASIGVNARSIEEICYFIVNETALLDETFVCRELADWFTNELHMTLLGKALEKALEEENPTEAFVLPILKEEAYLSYHDLQAFQRELNTMSRDKEAVRLKKKGDALVRCGRLAGAVNTYRDVLRLNDKTLSDSFIASVWHNIGVSHMYLLEYPEALNEFEQAMAASYTKEALKTYLFAYALSRPREKYEEELKKRGVDNRTAAEIEASLKQAAESVQYPDVADTKTYLADLMKEYHRAADA